MTMSENTTCILSNQEQNLKVDDSAFSKLKYRVTFSIQLLSVETLALPFVWAAHAEDVAQNISPTLNIVRIVPASPSE